MTESILQVRGLSGGYDRRNVVHDISLDVAARSIVSIIGPNGHGKTALMWLLTGLSRPSKGTVVFSGVDITVWPAHRIARAGLVLAPQGDLLFPQMTVGENLTMGGLRLGDARAVARRRDMVIGLFPKLAERENQTAGSLSGGERRMVGLGRALMSGAELLLIDEPSLGLAPIIIEQIYDAIVQMRAEGISIVIVEENPERASSIADMLHVMDDGRLIVSGTPGDVLKQESLLNTYFGT